MILHKLVMFNFRQFEGEQSIDFSTDPNRNVTVVHAENSTGKTTILYAMLWALYGYDAIRDSDMQQTQSLIHNGTAHMAVNPDACRTYVRLTFEHNRRIYVLERSITLTVQNANPNDSKLTLTYGNEEEPRPQNLIEKLLPQGISRYLFFNGERINYLALAAHRRDVTDAIQQMLGLKLLERTIADLSSNTLRELRKEQIANAEHAYKVRLQELETLESAKQRTDSEIEQHQKNVQALETSIATVDKRLLANVETQQLTETRLENEGKEKTISAQIRSIEKELKREIADRGYSMFAEKLIKTGRNTIKTLRAEGKVPARILVSLLDELLREQKCICQRDLIEQSEPYIAIQNLCSTAGNDAFNDAVAELEPAIRTLEVSREESMLALVSLQVDLSNLKKSLLVTQEELEDLRKQLGEKQGEDSLKLAKELARLREDKALQEQHISTKVALRGQQEIEIKNVQAEVKRLGVQETRSLLATRRVDAVEQCIEALKTIMEHETSDLRPLLNKEITELYDRIMPPMYSAHLNDSFELTITQSLGSTETQIEAALGNAQQTITALVFIASLLKLAKDRTKIETILSVVQDSVYPMVIDSPFAPLSTYRENVARHIPEFAPQVILLVSPEQYDEHVQKAFKDSNRIGKRYLLRYHGRRIPPGANFEQTFEDGSKIVQYVQDQSKDYTEVVALNL
jgi:DNA sulfur modification protein DndD